MSTASVSSAVLLVALTSAYVQAQHSGWVFEDHPGAHPRPAIPVPPESFEPSAAVGKPDMPAAIAASKPPVSTVSEAANVPGTPTTPQDPSSTFASEISAGRFSTVRYHISEALRQGAESNTVLARRVRARIESTQMELNSRFIVLVWEESPIPNTGILGRKHGIATSDEACNVINGTPDDECAETGGSLAFTATSLETGDPLYGLLVFYPEGFMCTDEHFGMLGAVVKDAITTCASILWQQHRKTIKKSGWDLTDLAECVQGETAQFRIGGMSSRVTAFVPSKGVIVTAPHGNYILVRRVLLRPQNKYKVMFGLQKKSKELEVAVFFGPMPSK